EVGEAEAALAFRQEEIPESRSLRLFFQLFDDRRRLPAIGALVDLADERLLVREDVLVHEVADALLERLHLVAVVEVHGTSSSELLDRGARVRTSDGPRPRRPRAARRRYA